MLPHDFTRPVAGPDRDLVIGGDDTLVLRVHYWPVVEKDGVGLYAYFGYRRMLWIDWLRLAIK